MSNFHFDLSLRLCQGEVHDFSGEVQQFSGEVRNDLSGGAHLPSKIESSANTTATTTWSSTIALILKDKGKLHGLKVTGHPFWRFAENRYCALNISPIFIKFSPNVLQYMQNMVKL
jgi:hypothetical protein